MNGTYDTFVVSGVKPTYNGNLATYSDGYIILNGEPMEFVGGTYNTLSENRWVIRNEEKTKNTFDDGSQHDSLIKTFASMSAEYQDGAIDVDVLSRMRLCHFVSGYTKSATIALSNITTAVTSVEEAHRFGFASVADATPKYSLQDGRFSISGYFKTSGSFTAGRNIIGVIPEWEGPEINGIKCELDVPPTEEGQSDKYHIFVDVRLNGNIEVQSGAYKVGACYGIAFDGTPYMVATR